MRNSIRANSIVLFTLFASSLSACGFRQEKTVPVDASGLTVSNISYRHVADSVLAPKCVNCHGRKGDVNLETYENVIASIDATYKEALVHRTMPPDEPLDPNEQRILSLWLEAGAPLVAGGAARITPKPGLNSGK